jgi:hypothetical protein
MPCRRAALQAFDHILAVKISGDMAHRAMRVEFGAVKAGDPGGLLPAMLQGVQAECYHRRSAVRVMDAEYTALLAEFIVIEGVGGEHVQSESRPAIIEPPIGAGWRNVFPL